MKVEEKTYHDWMIAKGLQRREVAPDGHCLFHALAYNEGGNYTYMQLRQLAASHMRENAKHFMTYWDEGMKGRNDATVVCGPEGITLEQFKQYCDTLEGKTEGKTSRSIYGGPMECHALSQALDVKITVWQCCDQEVKVFWEFEQGYGHRKEKAHIHLTHHKYLHKAYHFNIVEPAPPKVLGGATRRLKAKK